MKVYTCKEPIELSRGDFDRINCLLESLEPFSGEPFSEMTNKEKIKTLTLIDRLNELLVWNFGFVEKEPNIAFKCDIPWTYYFMVNIEFEFYEGDIIPSFFMRGRRFVDEQAINELAQKFRWDKKLLPEIPLRLRNELIFDCLTDDDEYLDGIVDDQAEEFIFFNDEHSKAYVCKFKIIEEDK